MFSMSSKSPPSTTSISTTQCAAFSSCYPIQTSRNGHSVNKNNSDINILKVTTRRRPRHNIVIPEPTSKKPITCGLKHPQHRKKRKRTIPEYVSVYKDNPLLTNEGQLAEISRATRARQQGNWQFARAILHALQEYAATRNEYLTESIHVRCITLLEKHPGISSEEMYADLNSIINTSHAKSDISTFNALLLGMKKKINMENTLDVLHNIVDLIEHKMKEKGVIPNQYTWSLIFSICMNCRNLKYLNYFEKSFYQYADNYSNNLNVIYSSLITARCKLDSNYENAIELTNNIIYELNIIPTERAFTSLLSLLNRSKLHSHILKYFEYIVEHEDQIKITSTYIFSSIISSCSRAGDIEAMNKVIEQMQKRSIPFGRTLLEVMFTTCIKCKTQDVALKILFNLGFHDEEFSPHISTVHFARIFSIIDNEQIVWETLHKMKFVVCLDPDIIIFNSVTDALVRLGNSQKAVEFIESGDMTRKYGIQKDLSTYKALIRAHGQLKNVKAILASIKDLKQEGLEMDWKTWNAVLHAAHSCGNEGTAIVSLASKAMNQIRSKGDDDSRKDGNDRDGENSNIIVLKELRAKGDVQKLKQIYIQSVRKQTKLDNRAYATIIATFMERGYEQDAISIFAWLMVRAYDTRDNSSAIFNVLIHQFGVVRYHKVRQQQQQLNREDKDTDVGTDSDIEQTAHIQAHLDNGYKTAERLFEMMKRRKRPPSVADEITYTTLIRTCCAHNKLDRAFRLLGEMQDIGIGMSDTYAWTSVIDGCAKQGQWERGIELYNAMVKGGGNVMPKPNISCYNAALYAAGIHGKNWPVAVDIYKQLSNDRSVHHDYVTFSAMASTILKCRFQIGSKFEQDFNVMNDVVKGLNSIVQDMHKERGNERFSTGRGRGRGQSGSSLSQKYGRKVESADIYKLKSKIKRLEWIIDLKNVEHLNRGKSKKK